MTTTPTPSVAGLSAVPELPVVGYFNSFGNALCKGVPRFSTDIALTPHAPAQATIAALSAEIERLKREKSELSYELGAAMQRCSLTIDRLTRERDALKAKQVADVEAVLQVGDPMSNVMFSLAQRPNERITSAECKTFKSLQVKWDAAREALRSHLTKDRT